MKGLTGHTIAIIATILALLLGVLLSIQLVETIGGKGTGALGSGIDATTASQIRAACEVAHQANCESFTGKIEYNDEEVSCADVGYEEVGCG